MDITRWIWRFLLFSPIKINLFNPVNKRCLLSVGTITSKPCSGHLFTSCSPLNLILNTMCFDAQSRAPLTTRSF